MSRALNICRKAQVQMCSRTSLCHQHILSQQIQACRKVSTKQTFTTLRIPLVAQCTDQRSIWTKSRLSFRCKCVRHFSVTEQNLRSTENCDIQDSSEKSSQDDWQRPLEMPEPEIDWEYICEENRESITANIVNRKGIGDINRVLHLKAQFDATGYEETRLELLEAASEIPNRSSPHSPIGDESNTRLVGTFGEKTEFKDFKPQKTSKLGEDLNLLRLNDLGITTGTRSYYFLAGLADLEHALIQLAITKLISRGFELVTVPEIIHPAVIEACGFHKKGEVTQVYTLDKKSHGEQCLIGTAEMPLAAFFLNEVLEEKELPRRLCSVSRCYRAEGAGREEKQGIYRVHQFTKVEMFGVTGSGTETEADNLLLEYVDIEKEMFLDLGLHFRILEMPTHELGAPAYRKFDIEAWMPAFGLWGEISSASNCTDYQSRRLNIKYRNSTGVNKYVHTVNGTACAVPRMVMAIFENFQNKDGSINIPEVLQPFMGGRKVLTKSDAMPTIQWIKHAKVDWES
ncbi:serine--tRNA ligase, mitochondrial-like [Mizuhopecten yessoensis]|uniref:serine--tRNA ligase n=1 Tax=Mizuhopecten yessoensis TaxID=6573 RepID=A0A210QUA5_MIZYE|nr:serine--tRNA ligase, mitochondrial-like [Mizuhopecten yessoensis]OWF52314.1 Serine--tRNA ligase, mitochondrial [Mizuhopecten yessoensis]